MKAASVNDRVVLCVKIATVTSFVIMVLWNLASLPDPIWRAKIASFLPTAGGFVKMPFSQGAHSSSEVSLESIHNVNLTAMLDRVKHIKECKDVAANPKSYWRSEYANGSLDTLRTDVARMDLAIKCGILYPDYFAKPVGGELYAFEKFYLSDPPLVSMETVSNENTSVVGICNSSLNFKVGETVVFKIEMRDSKGRQKLKGGDQIRAWFVDESTRSRMTLKVVDLNNGTYIASAPLLWAGKPRLQVALVNPREYIRAILHNHHVLKSFRHISAMFVNKVAREATPCYHTQAVPGFEPHELCNFTEVNGSPWYCGIPLKKQLSCSDYTGTAILQFKINPAGTEQEKTLFDVSSRRAMIPNAFQLYVSPVNSSGVVQLPCNAINQRKTWEQEIPIGYFNFNVWYLRLCRSVAPNYGKCLQNKQILILGDSNGRSHYYNFKAVSKCESNTTDVHKPLFCIDRKNNFSMIWNLQANPVFTGESQKIALQDLIPTSKSLDKIPSHGDYLVILNHYYHLTIMHFSAFDIMFRIIKDALVRLFKRNPNVQVVLQAPHALWNPYSLHYTLGDMRATQMTDLQQELFHDLKDKVVYISPWDMTIAAENMDVHPQVNNVIFKMICSFMCDRKPS